MKQDNSAISYRSMKPALLRRAEVVSGAIFGLLLAAGELSAAPVPDRQPVGPAAKWATIQEFSLSGNYVEACTDAPICPAHFGANRPGPGCRKVMIFQVTQGHWQNTDLSGLSAAIIAEAPDGETVSQGNAERWIRRELWLPEAADSAQAEGLTRALGVTVLGPGGPLFSHTERVPLAVGMTAKRIIVEVVQRLRVNLTPATSINGTRPPDLNNLGLTSRFLAALYVFKVDSLYCASWTPVAPALQSQSGLVATFGWTSQAAYPAAAVGKSTGKTGPN